ncbi:hypothetical protein [Brenneria corticis]|uniref:hypothetical protein n=1 Tax=Brenneria corticis TaxID=2173106 RepID=UPI001AEFA45A|nr:hypothetical protein [Brenneria sp. CFCC 11842]
MIGSSRPVTGAETRNCNRSPRSGAASTTGQTETTAAGVSMAPLVVEKVAFGLSLLEPMQHLVQWIGSNWDAIKTARQRFDTRQH